MHPVLFRIPTPWGDLPIFSYGFMLGLSVIVGWYFIMHMGEKYEGLSKHTMAGAFMATLISALIGARWLYVVTNLDQFQGRLLNFSTWFQGGTGGLVAYGGFLGGFLGAWAYLKLKNTSLLRFADVAAPALGSGLFFTRIGCWLFGCDFGQRLSEHAPGFLVKLGTFPRWDPSLFAGLVFNNGQRGSPAFEHHRALFPEQMLGRDASFPVHPTQLYESLVGLVLFLITYWVLKHRQFRGQVLLAMTLLYGLWRFLIEFVRDDPERGFAFGFSTSQLVAMALLPLCVGCWVVWRRHPPPKAV